MVCRRPLLCRLEITINTGTMVVSVYLSVQLNLNEAILLNYAQQSGVLVVPRWYLDGTLSQTNKQT